MCSRAACCAGGARRGRKAPAVSAWRQSPQACISSSLYRSTLMPTDILQSDHFNENGSVHWIDASAAHLGISRLQRQDFANAKHYVSRLVDVFVSIKAVVNSQK